MVSYICIGLMQADRDDRHALFAEKYEGSELKQVNLRALSQHMSDATELPAEMLKELSTKAETANPWFYGVYTLLRVRAGDHPTGPPLVSYLVEIAKSVCSALINSAIKAMHMASDQVHSPESVIWHAA